MKKLISFILYVNYINIFFTAYISAEPLSIGIINPGTGMFAEQGENCLKGYKFAISELSADLSEQINFAFEDDKSKTQEALSCFNRLLLHKNLIGTLLFGSHTVFAINPLAVSQKLPVIGLSGHSEFLPKNPYAISNWYDSSIEAHLLGNFAIEKGFKRIALISLEIDFTLYIRNELSKLFKEKGVDLVFDELIHSENDFRSLLVKLKSRKPELLIINYTGENFPLLMRQLHQQNIKIPKLTISANTSPTYFHKAGDPEITNNLILFNSDIPESFKEKDGYADLSLPAYTFACYLGIKALLQTIESLNNKADNSPITREEVRTHLTELKYIKLPDRKIPIKDRRIQFQLLPFQVKNHTLVPLQDSE